MAPNSVVLFYTDGLTEFNRDIDWAEAAVLRAVAQLVADPSIERPARFVQRSVMGAERPADDTVLLIAQVGATLQRSWNYDSRNSRDAHALRREIAHFIRSFSPTEEELFRAELIVGELLANTVEHAPGAVRVDIDWTETHPVVTISDEGPGLSRVAAALPIDALNENGRGLFLIGSLALDVHVETQPEVGTTMRIVLPARR
jgi:anti-sigma regulatory factor (Ser/Thr protein kinase)